MFRNLLAGTATAALLALGAQAQEAPAEDSAPASPGITAPETVLPPIVEDETQPGAAPQAQTTEEAEVSPTPPEMAEDSEIVPPSDTAAEPTPAVAPETDAAADAAPALPGPLPEGAVPVDLATVSPDTLIGADIRNFEGDSIAAVDDVMMSAEGKVDNIVARFGGFLGFGETKVLMAPAELTVVRQADDSVAILTSLTSDELQARPEYTAPETLGPEG